MMFLRIACLTLLQVILYSGQCVEAVECTHDTDCSCDKLQAKCDKHRHSQGFCVCHPDPHTDQTTSRQTDPPTTEVASTTSAPFKSDCSEFNITLHGCHDNSACTLPHVLEVICPDPKEAKYCPTKCECCPKVPLVG